MMNRKYFGNSYDIVKRFFIEEINKIGYRVVVKPMFTDKWDELEEGEYYKFIKADPLNKKSKEKSALFLDPDTGIGLEESEKHITIECVAKQLLKYDVVFSFDQSFSHTEDAVKKAREKLKLLSKTEAGNCGFYYDSHARFLFSAKSDEILKEVEQQLLSSGLPASRLLKE